MPLITTQMDFLTPAPEFYFNHFLFSTLRLKLEKQGLDHMAHYYYYMDPFIAKYTVIMSQRLQYYKDHPTPDFCIKRVVVHHFQFFLSEIGTRYPYSFLSPTWATLLEPHTLVAARKFQLMLNRLIGEEV